MWGWDRKILPEDHRLASWGLPSDNNPWSRGRDFQSHPHTNNGFFFGSPQNTSFYIGKTLKRILENPEYAEMRHGDVILTLQWRQGSTCDQRADNVRLFVFYLSLAVGTQRAYFELKYFKIVKMRDAKYSLKMAAEKWRHIFPFLNALYS